MGLDAVLLAYVEISNTEGGRDFCWRCVNVDWVVAGNPHRAGKNLLVLEVQECSRSAQVVQLTFRSTTPGMPSQVMATAADGFKSLTESRKKISIKDMRLPWRPIYDILSQDLFLTRRQFEYTCVILRISSTRPYISPPRQLPWVMGYIAANSRRFFHPAATNEMLSVFVPLLNGTDLDVSTFLHLPNRHWF